MHELEVIKKAKKKNFDDVQKLYRKNLVVQPRNTALICIQQ